MSEGKFAICKMYSMALPSMPKRSYLNNLVPVNLGTPYVESMTGYTARLADSHSVSVDKLIKTVLLPAFADLNDSLNVDYKRKSALQRLSLTTAYSINAAQGWADPWVHMLETMTLRNDLRFLTLLPWAEMLPSQANIRVNRNWCPYCYEDWRIMECIVYDPLLWCIDGVVFCPKHCQPLQTICCNCNNKQYQLSANTRPGYCSNCQNWLGIYKQSEFTQPVAVDLSEKEKEQSLWFSNAVGEMLASAVFLAHKIQRKKIAENINRYVVERYDGKYIQFAYSVNYSYSTVQKWKEGISNPPLSILSQICYNSGISLLDFFTKELVVSKDIDEKSRDLPTRYSVRKLSREDMESMRLSLEYALSDETRQPRSLAEIFRETGYGYDSLYKYFPDLCSALLKKRQDYQEAKNQRFREEVRRLVFSLHNQGIYPSHQRIQEATMHFAISWNSIAVWWREAIQEVDARD
jgi:hypothetical protein